MKYEIEIVSDKPNLWKDGDPVRPELGVSYKTYPGRQVYGLKDESGEHVAFCCVARTWGRPTGYYVTKQTHIRGWLNIRPVYCLESSTWRR